MSTTTERPRAIAERVLAERRAITPDLLDESEVKEHTSDWIGFEIRIPHPDGERHIGSSAAMRVADATHKTLEDCFDEGLRVCRELAAKAQA